MSKVRSPLGSVWWCLRMCLVAVFGVVLYLVPVCVNMDSAPLDRAMKGTWIGDVTGQHRDWFRLAEIVAMGLIAGYGASLSPGAGAKMGLVIGFVVALPLAMLAEVSSESPGVVLAGRMLVFVLMLAPPTLGGLLAGWVKARGRRRRRRVQTA